MLTCTFRSNLRQPLTITTTPAFRTRCEFWVTDELSPTLALASVPLETLSLFFSFPLHRELPTVSSLVPVTAAFRSISAFLQTPNMQQKTAVALLLFLTGTLKWVVVAGGGDSQGFCSSGYNIVSSENIYHKVTNPTLSPIHLQDLPGFTRSVYRNDHALITPESHVFSPLPNWVNALGAYLVTPAMGSHFVMYLVHMQALSTSALPPQEVERFFFVLQGDLTLKNASGISHKMLVDSYAYIPANFEHSLTCQTSAALIVFERRYVSLQNHTPEQIIGSTDLQPLLDTPGEIFELRKLLPSTAAYDFNIHIMDFQPGEFLNVKEVHYNQHGLLLLEGQGIYRLGDNWYPVQAGDAIWMAPFVPQWYAALGKSRSRYLLYKDVNRSPL